MALCLYGFTVLELETTIATVVGPSQSGLTKARQ
jgi:hypothetical protein